MPDNNEISLQAISELNDALNMKIGSANKNLPSKTEALGEFLGVDDEGQAWIKISGNDFATPLTNQSTTAEIGDILSVSVDNGRAYGKGNLSSPSITENVFSSSIEPIEENLGVAQRDIQQNRTVADEAKAVALATHQHIWTDEMGIHVSENPKKDWDEQYALDGHGELSDPDEEVNAWANILMNAYGQLLRSGLINLLSLTRSALAFYDGEGNDDTNIVISVGKDGVIFSGNYPQRIGGDNAYIDYDSQGNMNIVADSITFAGRNLETEFTDVDADIDEARRTATDFLSFINGELVISISDSTIVSALSNSKFAFRTDAGDITYFGLNDDSVWEMYIDNARVNDMLRFGDFAWIKRQNGNMSIKWLGA